MPDDEMCYWPTTDSALFRWMEAHPAGFVLNIERGPRAAYMVLHRSRCPHIAALASDAPGGFTQRDYRKVCATSRHALQAWVRDHGSPNGRFSQECQTCAPGTAASDA